MKCQPTAEMGVHKMNILVGIWPCQLLEPNETPYDFPGTFWWHITAVVSIKMSDSTVILLNEMWLSQIHPAHQGRS